METHASSPERTQKAPGKTTNGITSYLITAFTILSRRESMNHSILIGRLTRDVDLRYIQGSGMASATFTLAVNKQLSKEKKQQFEQQGKPTADFIQIQVWGKMAENCANYLEKGRQVAIQGHIDTSTYEKEGQKHFSVKVVASHVEFIDWGEKKPQSGQGQKPAGNFQAFDDGFANDFKAIEDDDDIPF